MSHARAAIAGVLAAVVVVIVAGDPAPEDAIPVGVVLLIVIALLLLPDLMERLRRD